MKLWSNTEQEWREFTSSIPQGQVEMARCISVPSPQDIQLESLGRHWTTKEHWYSYGQNILKSFPHGLYCIFGKTTRDNIEWGMSHNMFRTYDDEYELFVIDPSKVTDLRIYEVTPECELGKEVTDEIIQ